MAPAPPPLAARSGPARPLRRRQPATLRSAALYGRITVFLRAPCAAGTGPSGTTCVAAQHPHGEHPAVPPLRPEGRHRVFRRPRHQRGAALDARQGRDPLRVHGEPRPARRARLRRHPPPRAAVRRREGAAGRLPQAAGGRGLRGAAVRRLPHLDRRRALLQHHAARPRGDRHDAGGRDEGGRRPHLGRRQHVQGQRHRALLPLRPAREPGPADLQALARPAVHRRARRAQGDVRVHEPGGARLPDERREGVLDRLQHPRRHARGQGSRVPEQGHHHRPADHGRRLLARRRRGRARDGLGPLRGRASRSRSTAGPSPTRSSCCSRPTPSAGATASA